MEASLLGRWIAVSEAHPRNASLSIATRLRGHDTETIEVWRRKAPRGTVVMPSGNETCPAAVTVIWRPPTVSFFCAMTAVQPANAAHGILPMTAVPAGTAAISAPSQVSKMLEVSRGASDG